MRGRLGELASVIVLALLDGCGWVGPGRVG